MLHLFETEVVIAPGSDQKMARVLQLYEPDAILLEHAAAHQSFWPTLPVDKVAATMPRARRLDRLGFRLLRRLVPPDLIQDVGGLRMTVPALTALDLGADAIDFALRTGAATLSEMWAALEATPRHRGNVARRLVLQESSNDCKLAIEVNGRPFHGDASFERDRWKQNAIVLAGWHILRFTWRMLEDHPDRVVAAVENTLGRWGKYCSRPGR